MKKLFLICLALTSLTFYCCKDASIADETPSLSDANINYYLKASTCDNIESIELSFLYARAYQEIHSEEDVVIRSIYLDSDNYQLNTHESNNNIYMGESSIEPSIVEEFDVNFGTSVLIQQDGQTREVQLQEPSSNGFRTRDLEIGGNEEIKVIFELDMEKSKLDTISGIETFVPVFCTYVSR